MQHDPFSGLDKTFHFLRFFHENMPKWHDPCAAKDAHLQCRVISPIFTQLKKTRYSQTNGPTGQWTNSQTDQKMDRPFYKDLWTHLKIAPPPPKQLVVQQKISDLKVFQSFLYAKFAPGQTTNKGQNWDVHRFQSTLVTTQLLLPLHACIQ